jgi:hypothetical protein
MRELQTNAEDQKTQGPVRKQHINDVGKHFPKASNYLCQVPTQFCYILHLYHMISIHLFNISPFWWEYCNNHVGRKLSQNKYLVFLRWIFVIVFHFLIFPLCAFYFQGNLNSIPKGLSVKLLLLS